MLNTCEIYSYVGNFFDTRVANLRLSSQNDNFHEFRAQKHTYYFSNSNKLLSNVFSKSFIF